MSASVRTNSAPGSSRPEQSLDGTVAELPCHVLAESAKTLLPRVHHEIIPDELLVSLTSTVCNENSLMPSAHQRHCKGCAFRRPDAVWHHPIGRKKYKYFLEQPTSLTGAGRDISFLCDGSQRKATTLPPLSERADDTQNLTVSESLIPEDYHIVKNKGLRNLELYEDAFTVQLQDDEQKLRVFPSMKPSGRQEVLQLMRVMDDMLKRAGVEQQSEELNELSQMEGLLELVRTEQNIYNVVFHELIRQVSVGCAERGQLLAKLRQHYQSLLERIPRHLKALHTEAVAQRALDRQLTVEIHRIKTSIQQLSRELSRIRDHDAFISQQAERAQQQLAMALDQTQNNSEVVQSYHELYELQRSRLNTQLLQMAEERDLWSQFTHCLALKVITVKDLQLVSQLHASEETWHETAEHCSIYLTSKDTEDLKALTDTAHYWKEQLMTFMSQLKKKDNAQCDQIRVIQQGVAKWKAFCTTQDENHVQKVERASVEEIHTDFQKWLEVLGAQCESYQGDEVLGHNEALEKAVSVQDRWLDMCIQLLRQHSSPDSAQSEHYHGFTELQIVLSELHKHLTDHITGENGTHSQLRSLSQCIESWIFKLANLIGQPQIKLVLDLKKLEKSLAAWQSLVDKTLQNISGIKTEDQTQTNKPDLYIVTKEVLDKVKAFIAALTSFTDKENQTVSKEVNSIHMSRTRWMLDLLLLLVPDLDDQQDHKQKYHHITNISVQQLEEDANALAQKVDQYSKYFTSSCQQIFEEQILKNPYQVVSEKEMSDCRNLESECIDWVDTSKILLSSLNIAPLQPVTALGGDLASGLSDSRESLRNSEAQVKDETEDRPTQSTDERFEPQTEQGETAVHESSMLEMIGSDRSIIQKKLGDSKVHLTGTEELVVSPVTEDAQKAFNDLSTVGVLQQELHDSEEQVLSAEQRALKAEEALQAALQKIQDLERQLQEPKKPLPSTSLPSATKPTPTKKAPLEAKVAASSKKTKKH